MATPTLSAAASRRIADRIRTAGPDAGSTLFRARAAIREEDTEETVSTLLRKFVEELANEDTTVDRPFALLGPLAVELAREAASR